MKVTHKKNASGKTRCILENIEPSVMDTIVKIADREGIKPAEAAKRMILDGARKYLARNAKRKPSRARKNTSAT